RNKIKGAMMYPIILMTFAVIAVVVLLVKVIPTIVSLFPDPELLPSVTKFVLNASDFMQIYRWIIGIIVVSIIIVYRFSYKRILLFKIFIDDLVLKLPAAKDAIKTFYLYRFSKLLGDFYKA